MGKIRKKKNSIRIKRLNVLIEELKQRIDAIAAKFKGIRDWLIGIDKTDYLKIIKDSFIRN